MRAFTGTSIYATPHIYLSIVDVYDILTSRFCCRVMLDIFRSEEIWNIRNVHGHGDMMNDYEYLSHSWFSIIFAL